LLTAVLAVVHFVSGCDNADGPTNVLSNSPKIDELEIQPSSLNFSGEDGIRDTVITFAMTVRSDLPEDHQLVAQLITANTRQELASDTLIQDSGNPRRFTGSFTLEDETSSFTDVLVYIYPLGYGKKVGDRFEKRINVRWEDIGSPEIIAVNHPDTITIPQTGQPDAGFFISAEANHPFSRDFIAEVRLELYDSNENLIFTSSMSDQNPDFGNEPGDGIYVQNFGVSSTNNPDVYSVEVHAVNILGTRSDTLRSTLVFTQ